LALAIMNKARKDTVRRERMHAARFEKERARDRLGPHLACFGVELHDNGRGKSLAVERLHQSGRRRGWKGN
jgi:hypothetical protein